jgi:hypothetical protein
MFIDQLLLNLVCPCPAFANALLYAGFVAFEIQFANQQICVAL